MCKESQLYHIFKIKIEKDFYRTERIYTDEEFEQIMDSIGWHMPFNLSAYHFMSHNPPICTNPVMNALPIIHCQVDKLLSTQISVPANMRDKRSKSNHEIFRKWEKFVIVRDELSNGVCGKLHRLDEEHTVVSKLLPLPITFKHAKEYVNKYHRHNTAPQGHKFSIGLMSPIDEEVIGVVIASVPKSRILAQDPYMLEINRCCSNAYYENVCSKLYSLAVKAGRSMGYRRFITYTLESEPGSSLKAVGFRPDGIVPSSHGGWDSPSRPRKKAARYPEGKKVRWILDL